tara:strand:- start:1038 stop:1964 length:927 start_codon:yes stop_codon:yes gene_type:complete
MLKVLQQTLSKPIKFIGKGLHTGKDSSIKIMPGLANQGIIFKRTDLKKNNIITANYKNVSSAKLCTTLENEFGVKVSTVEHLLAAFYIAGVDNAVVEINNEEVPIMDGSAHDFLEEIKKIKLKELTKKRKYLRILNKVELIDGDRKISIEKNNSSFEVKFKLNYKNKIIGKQENKVNFYDKDLYDVINSRTFCLYEDIEKIKKLGLAKGGSLENALVVDKDKVLNKGGLRNKKEFVNHKILDLAGDFLLSGFRVLGSVECHHGGHELSNLFLKKLLNTKTAFEVTEIKQMVVSEKIRSNQSIKIAVNA